MEQNSGKIQKVKEALSGLLEKYPDSPEAANWKKMQEDLSKCLKHLMRLLSANITLDVVQECGAIPKSR